MVYVKYTQTDKDNVVRLHNDGHTRAAIARITGISRLTVTSWLVEMGLPPNSRRMFTEINGMSVCNKCGETKPVERFPFNRKGGKYEGRLSYCQDCRTKQMRQALNNPRAYMQDKANRLRIRSSAAGREFNLTCEYLLNLYEAQERRCIYTDEPLRFTIGEGSKPGSASVDRVDTTKGYVEGNVVFCSRRANVIKHNMTLTEFAEWMPTWYARLELLRKKGIKVAQVQPGDF